MNAEEKKELVDSGDMTKEEFIAQCSQLLKGQGYLSVEFAMIISISNSSNHEPRLNIQYSTPGFCLPHLKDRQEILPESKQSVRRSISKVLASASNIHLPI